MKRKESRSSTFLVSLPIVILVYSVIFSNSCLAWECKLSEYLNFHSSHSSLRCSFNFFVLSDKALIICVELTLFIVVWMLQKLCSWASRSSRVGNLAAKSAYSPSFLDFKSQWSWVNEYKYFRNRFFNSLNAPSQKQCNSDKLNVFCYSYKKRVILLFLGSIVHIVGLFKNC